MNDCIAANPAEAKPTQVVAFRDAQWKTRWLIVGLAGLLFWHSLSFVDWKWLAPIPWWLFVIVTSAIPQVLLLLFPMLTRNPRQRSSFGLPTKRRCAMEIGIAIPIAIATVVVLAVAEVLVRRASSGTSLTPDVVSDLAVSPNRLYACCISLFACTFGPIAEEVFFRGFLYNALRARVPWLVAGFVQSFVFGFSHFFGMTHSIVAFVLGLLLTVIYEWRKTLVTPIAIHVGINLVAALGVVAVMITQANRPELGVIGDPEADVCVIRKVVPDSAAAAAGIQAGDVVTKFNGKSVRDFRQLAERVRYCQAGDEVLMEINRSGSGSGSGSVYEVKVVLRKGRKP
jgi:membrane protease YdiL (CAAX protease family)